MAESDITDLFPLTSERELEVQSPSDAGAPLRNRLTSAVSTAVNFGTVLNCHAPCREPQQP